MLSGTILAISSPPISSAAVRGIVRLSGEHAWGLVRRISDPADGVGPGYQAITLRLPGIAVTGGIILFRGPRSFTGEDVAGIQAPGSPALLRRVVEALLAQGREAGWDVREAVAGEFAARAFFNGKIDLTEAEGIAATIQAKDERQLRAAAAMSHGATYRWMQATTELLADLLARLEAGLDFADEADVSFIGGAELAEGIHQLRLRLEQALRLAGRADAGEALPVVVFMGLPNAGKSSLINALCGSGRALVSEAAGTTRDALSAVMHAAGGGQGRDVRLVDVPGEEVAGDALRQEMMRARERALLQADLVVEVVDASQARDCGEVMDRMQVLNKSDLLGENFALPVGAWGLVSAKTGYGLERLRAAIVERAYHAESGVGIDFALNSRQRVILREVGEILKRVEQEAIRTESQARHPELIAADLRLALDALGNITGAVTPEDVLGRVFARFCIGK